MNPATIPLAVYLHFPWCVSKCPYCDFNSFARREPELPEARYVDVLRADLDAQQARFAIDRPVSSVFLGGGTPSLFAPDAIGRILEHLRRQFRLAPDAEVTLEANPGTLEHGRFAAYRDAGVTRVSLGVQSFDDAQLRRLGRIHSADDARRAAAELHAAGLANFNIDLMYGLPEQTIAGARDDVAQALALEPAHLSHYQLTMEPGTPFAAAPPPLPDDDSLSDMLDACLGLMTAAGFERYEVSGYARAGRQCCHNLNYWRFGDYLGAGAGAHGKVTRADGPYRTQQAREPRRYMALALQSLTVSRVDEDQRPFEFMLNALRLLQGFDRSLFVDRTGLGWSAVAQTWDQGVRQGLLEVDASGQHRATSRGLDFLNEALKLFMRPSGRKIPNGDKGLEGARPGSHFAT